MYRQIAFIFLLIYSCCLHAQSDSLLVTKDSLITEDKTEVKEKKKMGFIGRIFKKDYPSPKKAAYLSLAFPGLGQAYNKRYWKLPIVYAAYGGLIYGITFNTSEYRRYRDAYAAELAGEEHEFSNIPSADAATLKRFRDGNRKNMELTYIGLVILHLLQATEAFVDAHLISFDVSDDLSLDLNPSFEYQNVYTGPTLGLGISLHPRNKKTPQPKPFLRNQ